MLITWESFTIEPRHPFRISRSTQERVRRVWVRVESDAAEGWGEADPSAYYGETAGTVCAALERMRTVLETADPSDLDRIEDDLRVIAAADGSARAAVMAALYDLAGKQAGAPLWRIWGLDPTDAPLSSFTIGLDEPEVLRQKVREAAAYPILKIKLGTHRDESLLRTVREAACDRALRVDANGSWTADETLDKLPLLRELGVELIEQPLPPEDREGYRRLHESSDLPIFVDESCVDSRDVHGLVGLADGINIKLAKCGGPREALRMIDAARDCGLQVMVGCMLESTLGIAPAAHLAPLVDHADLDGAALLAADPFTGPGLDGPRIRLDDKPGLGVERA